MSVRLVAFEIVREVREGRHERGGGGDRRDVGRERWLSRWTGLGDEKDIGKVTGGC